MRKFLILKTNLDPYCGGDFNFVRAKNLETFSKKLKRDYNTDNIVGIYDVTNSIELSSFFLN